VHDRSPFITGGNMHTRLTVVEAKEKDSNRSRDQIMAEMLQNMVSPVRKTAVMYNARLSYTQLTYYHDLLLRFGLIERVAEASDNYSGFWVATEKGRIFLDAYATIRAISR
jgi:predicted transcriptional regulator